MVRGIGYPRAEVQVKPRPPGGGPVNNGVICTFILLCVATNHILQHMSVGDVGGMDCLESLRTWQGWQGRVPHSTYGDARTHLAPSYVWFNAWGIPYWGAVCKHTCQNELLRYTSHYTLDNCTYAACRGYRTTYLYISRRTCMRTQSLYLVIYVTPDDRNDCLCVLHASTVIFYDAMVALSNTYLHLLQGMNGRTKEDAGHIRTRRVGAAGADGPVARRYTLGVVGAVPYSSCVLLCGRVRGDGRPLTPEFTGIFLLAVMHVFALLICNVIPHWCKMGCWLKFYLMQVCVNCMIEEICHKVMVQICELTTIHDRIASNLISITYDLAGSAWSMEYNDTRSPIEANGTTVDAYHNIFGYIYTYLCFIYVRCWVGCTHTSALSGHILGGRHWTPRNPRTKTNTANIIRHNGQHLNLQMRRCSLPQRWMMFAMTSLDATEVVKVQIDIAWEHGSFSGFRVRGPWWLQPPLECSLRAWRIKCINIRCIMCILYKLYYSWKLAKTH